jgi:hypothetical protein
MKTIFLPLLLSASLCTSLASAQCVDPKPGTDFIEHVDQVVTYTDGYKTYMDVRYPAAAPGPCGWPMIVLVHTSGTSRDMVTPKAQIMALRGFLTVTYDVRGQGQGMTLNDPLVYGREVLGLRERLDMFEIMEEVESRFPGVTDLDRIGVTGRSQGALHSFMAAAHSGRTLPTNPWRTAPCPTITAVAPINFGPQFMLSAVPDNQNFSEMLTRQFFEDEAISGVHHTPDFLATLRSYIDAGDFEGAMAAMVDPTLDPTLWLKDSVVPIFAQLAWDDKYGPVNKLCQDWDDFLVPGTWKVMNHSVSGHNTPVNTPERDYKEYRRIQFFEYFLKGIDRGVQDWPSNRFLITPLHSGRYNDPNYLWDGIPSETFPLEDAYTQSFYFDTNHRMVDEHPATVGLYELQHQAFGFTLDDYINLLPQPEALVATVPRQAIEFVMDPLPQESILIGTPTAKLRVKCAQPDLQVEVALFEHTTDRYLTSGFTTIRNHDGQSEIEIDFEMRMCAFQLPAGTVLRAEISNLAWHQTPTPATFLSALPLFTDYELHLATGGDHPAQIELPFVQWDQPILSTDAPYVLRAGNVDRRLSLSCYDEATFGWPYQILAGFSGTSPGWDYFGEHVPLNIDPLVMNLFHNPRDFPIAGFSGHLDAEGKAVGLAQMSVIPMIPSIIEAFDCVAILANPDGTEARVSNLVHVEFD